LTIGVLHLMTLVPMVSNNRVVALGLVTLCASLVLAQEASDVTYIGDASVDRKPRHTVVPVYPPRALRDRIEGEVEVCFDVDRKGRTSRIAVRRSSNRLFEKPAIEAVRRSSYAAVPAERALSGIKTCRTFRFRLDPVAVTDPDADSGGSEP
jgi:TonB family protein